MWSTRLRLVGRVSAQSRREYWRMTRTSVPPRHPDPRPTQAQLDEQSRNFPKADIAFRTEFVEPPFAPVRVILQFDMIEYGQRGQVLTLADPALARQELILPGLAVYATPESEREFGPALIPEAQLVMSTPTARDTMLYMIKHVLPVSLHHRHAWTITPEILHASFRRVRLQVPAASITLPSQPIQGPDPVLENREFLIEVTINGTERFPVRCVIHHMDPDQPQANRLKGWQHRFHEPVLESQREALFLHPRRNFGPQCESDPALARELVQYRHWCADRHAQLFGSPPQ